MFIRKNVQGIILVKGGDGAFDPPAGQSSRWMQWVTEQDLRVCAACQSMQGRVYSLYEEPDPAPPLHPNCRCRIEGMGAVTAGFGTKDGIGGADWWLKHHGSLPEHYIAWDELLALGYEWGKPPQAYAPGRMIHGGEFRNADGHLPGAPGRVWYKADINYDEGRRNGQRIIWSNDGLIFVTYDHYHTFYEIV